MCSTCRLKGKCIPEKLNIVNPINLDNLIYKRIFLKKGQPLFKDFNLSEVIFCIRHGAIKVQKEGKSPKIVGFFFPAQIIWLPEFQKHSSAYGVIALEDTELCIASLALIKNHYPSRLFDILSEENSRLHKELNISKYCNTDQKIAFFLLNLSKHYATLGYSPTEFILKMSIGDISSYLGVAYETVSRMLAIWKKSGIINIDNKHISILNPADIKKKLNINSEI